MRVKLRILLFAGAVMGALALSASAANAASFGIEKFVAVNCTTATCAEEKVGPFSEPVEETLEEVEENEEAFTQAGGRVPFGITHFKVKTEGPKGEVPGPPGEQIPAGGPVTHIRTDVAPGLATNPQAVPECSQEEFGTEELGFKGSGAFAAPTCSPATEIGSNKVTVYVEAIKKDVPLEGTVYNLTPVEGHASEFGVALSLELLGKPGVFAHTLIKGNVEWGKGSALLPKYIGTGTNAGDYHDYFEIEVSSALPLVASRLVFIGNENQETEKADDFITNATRCPGSSTTTLRLESETAGAEAKPYTPPVSLNNCGAVPFEPGFALTPATLVQDQPDGFTNETTVHHETAAPIDNSEVKSVTVKLPEGMTLNPSAAAGLTACTPAQARITSSEPGVACPSTSEVGTVSIEVPTLPAGSLKGSLYLGGPESGPITGPPYTMYLDAESARYGVSVRLKGEVFPNEETGQLTTVFNELPEQPFSNAILHFKEGALAPVANPLACANVAAIAELDPYSGNGIKSVASNLSFSGCSNPLGLSPTQSTSVSDGNAGDNTSFTFNLERPEGNQYLSQVTTTLPKGLAGAVPAVEQCGEPQASQGTCGSGSQIGTAVVLAGSGPTPYTFTGPVYFTGPYNNAPFGLSIAVPSVAGPFNLGTVVTRASINVQKYTGQVIVSTALPRIVKGVPIRIRKIIVTVNKQGFMRNPTNCAPLTTESSVTGYVPGSSESATATAKSPFQVGNCAKLAFKPGFTATTSAKVSKANGASLETTIKMPSGDSNIKSVLVQLPKQLVSRLTTLQKACLAANFENNPYSCPPGSFVGGVTAKSPLLPGTLTGPAILVSHGGEAFPDLDLVMNGSGVRVIAFGHTKITKGITTTNFFETPDLPVDSVTVNLPTGSHSAVTNNGDLCKQPLVMPTTITGWNGASFKQNTTIKVKGCGVRIVGQKTVGNTAYMTVQTFAGGRISGSGNNLKTVYKKLKKASKSVSLKVPLSSSGENHGRPLKVRVRVGFVPSKKGESTSKTYKTVTFH
ncbi:MAG TPA: hypothetical protein VMI13_05320 [Solirubrobacteraceae bacterium]|nr:hypothetical protein [Solirubrobacteraceae bacterium]